MAYTDTIHTLHDNILIVSDSVLRCIHQINTTTAMNTSPRPWTWISVSIAAIALFIAFMTWMSQKRTEKNTLQINPEGQERILLDIIRHLYANMVATVTLTTLLRDCGFSKYPSEEHLLKLKVDPSYLHPELFSNKSNEYERLHNLIVLFRNYNVEIDTALLHFKDRTLARNVKERDASTLLLKPGLLTRRIIGACNVLFDGKTAKKAREKIREEYSRRGHNSSRHPALTYYNNLQNGFIEALYSENEADAKEFLDMLNGNVAHELARNEENSAKIGLIDFH